MDGRKGRGGQGKGGGTSAVTNNDIHGATKSRLDHHLSSLSTGGHGLVGLYTLDEQTSAGGASQNTDHHASQEHFVNSDP